MTFKFVVIQVQTPQTPKVSHGLGNVPYSKRVQKTVKIRLVVRDRPFWKMEENDLSADFWTEPTLSGSWDPLNIQGCFLRQKGATNITKLVGRTGLTTLKWKKKWPVSWLPFRYSFSKFLRFPMDPGMLPAAKGGKKHHKLGWSYGTDHPKNWEKSDL